MTNFLIHKKPGMIFFLAFCFSSGFSQHEAEAIKEIEQHRKKQKETFRKKQESPLLKADRKKFKGLKTSGL